MEVPEKKISEYVEDVLMRKDLKDSDYIDPDQRAEISPKSETKENDFDPDTKAEVSEKKKGGSYGELKEEGHGWNSDPPEEVHHMPSAEASPLERNDGPAIVMEREDHRETASCGNSREAREYREKQKELIQEGKFEEAMQMDIEDIRDKFGDKYDEGIKQAEEYYKSIKEEKGV